MKMRSLLFVPGDSEHKVARAAQSGADALILDLEDSVAPTQKDLARNLVSRLVAESVSREWRCFVRINPFDSGLALADLAAVVRPGLDAILLPKVNGIEDVVRLGHCLDALEEAARMPTGQVRIAVVATETPAAMFALGSYAGGHPRLVALTWGAEDLAAAIGASGNKDAAGDWTLPFAMARAQCLWAAACAEVPAIDTLYADFRDLEGLAADCACSRRDGFSGRIAIHPDQVATINAAFSPSAEELARARRIVEAFAKQPDAGALGIDGQMLDIPHLKMARRVVAAAGEE